MSQLFAITLLLAVGIAIGSAGTWWLMGQEEQAFFAEWDGFNQSTREPVSPETGNSLPGTTFDDRPTPMPETTPVSTSTPAPTPTPASTAPPTVPSTPTAVPIPRPTIVKTVALQPTPTPELTPQELLSRMNSGKMTREEVAAILGVSLLPTTVPTPTRAPLPTSSPTPPLDKLRFSQDYLESAILRYLNDFRVAEGLRELRVDERLAGIALAHSKDMARNGYYNHVNLQGEDPSARARRSGYDCNNPMSIGIAENIHVLYGHTSRLRTIIGTTYEWETQETMARRFAADFIASAGHRQIILDSRYGLTGVGVAFGEFNGINHAIFVTHNFC